MKRSSHIPIGTSALRLGVASATVCMLLWVPAGAQQPGSAVVQPASPATQRETLDRVVAIVNSDLILESDVESEAHFVAFEPFSEPQPVSTDNLTERLIDRDLIEQQMRLQPEPAITDAQVNAQLALLRKSLPNCGAYHCETDAGWLKFIADQGFTLDDLKARWKERMQVLQFVEERFRMGTRISQSEIDDYYQKTMLPAYKKQNQTPPAEATINERIQEVLLEQQVTLLLNDWLKSLRAQGSVRIMKSGEATP